ncbi:MAG: hypothetical protein ACRDQ2_08595, partial [Gaiellales bacterium]
MRFPRSLSAAICSGLVVLLVTPLAWATPVARTKEERDLYGRVFLEPVNSVDFIQFDDEFPVGMKLLDKLYPRYLEFTTIDKELGDPRAVSLGPDGRPAWD